MVRETLLRKLRIERYKPH